MTLSLVRNGKKISAQRVRHAETALTWSACWPDTLDQRANAGARLDVIRPSPLHPLRLRREERLNDRNRRPAPHHITGAVP